MMKIQGETLEELWKNTVASCTNYDAIENVLLTGIFNIEQTVSNFIDSNMETAEKFQNKVKPEELIINHGSYISKKDGGIDFIINELKNKNNGNRACFSLINMEDIMDSGDEVIPSFMVLQFSFPKDNPKKLLATAYYRGLEVKNFLPINLSEICLNIKHIKTKFPSIEEFELNIYAFRIQVIERFNCLKHSSLDIMDPVKMTILLMGDRTEIIEALKEKARMVESCVVNTGLCNLKNVMEHLDEKKIKNKIKIQERIEKTLQLMESLRGTKASTSINSITVQEKTSEINDEIESIIKYLEDI